MKRNHLFSILLIALSSGCSSEKPLSPRRPEEPAEASEQRTLPTEREEAQKPMVPRPWDPTLGKASIVGFVRFAGPIPPLKPLDTSSAPQCARIHKGPIMDQSLIVGPQRGLKNAVVWIREGLEMWDFPSPTEPAVVEQRGCQFEPHVLAIRVGQELRIRNSDPLIHNVHAFPRRSTSFNFTQAQQGMENARTFPRPETMVPIRCDIHPWMSCYVTVVAHPFFSVTSKDGWFELSGLPPGEYTVEVVHELLGRQRHRISVANGQQKSIELVFHAKGESEKHE